MILGIFSKKQNPNGSENAGHAIYWFKGLSANKRESGITGFSSLHLLYHWEQAPKMVQEVGLAPHPLCSSGKRSTKVNRASGPARSFSIESGPLLDNKALCRQLRVVLQLMSKGPPLLRTFVHFWRGGTTQ